MSGHYRGRQPSHTVTISVGFDVGGTFTDLMLYDGASDRWVVEKTRTTSADQSRGCLTGLEALSLAADVSFEAIEYFAHGTTVATNTLVERRGEPLVLVTTRGFRDVLEIRRQIMPHRYDASVPKPEPLVSRPHRLEVDERTLADGAIEQGVDRKALTTLLEEVRENGVDTVAICFLHAYANPENERVAEEVARSLGFASVVGSHRVLNEHREYERTATVAANAYIAPPMERYLAALADAAQDIGVQAPLLIFQSNGGLVPAEQAAALPIACLLSGPAAGVVGAIAIAREQGLDRVITFDMGGTSCDVSLIDHYEPRLAFESEIAGWPIRTPRLDIHSVGAGGGSIAWIDSGGLLRVGPQSSSAEPGPAAYGQGGTEATVTDAHVVLGHLGAETPLAGQLFLDVPAASAAVERLGEQLGLSLDDTAAGILDVVNATMARAIRLVSLEHGHDPRRYTLVAFGGAGPLHACDLVRELGLRDAIVPPRPGLLCALGLLAADLRVDASISRRLRLGSDGEGVGADEILAGLREVDARARESKAVLSRSDLTWTPSYTVDMRYFGQSFDLPVPVAASETVSLDVAQLSGRFDEVHASRYGHAVPDRAREVIGFRVSLRASGGDDRVNLPSIDTVRVAFEPTDRSVYFKGHGWSPCRVYPREALAPGSRIEGPSIIEQMDSTTLVSPDFVAFVDDATNIVLTRKEK